ncbi:MAG TPA: universal stress protein, partial [Azonexus sp.]|nr:universal stress protein [Azonexus sp.]
MFKHVLIPTDGSDLSRTTAQKGVLFAKEIGAKVTVFFAKPEYPIAYFGEGALIDPTTPERFSEIADEQA